VAEPQPPLIGLVLAGGRSRRFGSDKALARYDGESLLSHVVAAVGSVLPDVRVAARPEQLQDATRRQFRLIADRYSDIGPAAGILAAHDAEPDAAWLVVACDMPRLDAATLAVLVAARDAAREATAYRASHDGLPEPLCAIYEPATLARFRRQVEQGGNPSSRAWLASADTVLIELPDAGALANVNTPEDLDRLRS
jgi:molybdopterin-guanine dinucleotide biosynthesis protein A